MGSNSKKLTEIITEIIIPGFLPITIYEAARDNQERFSEFMADVEQVKILEHGSDNHLPWIITDWITDIEGTPLLWTEKDFFHGLKDGRFLITWELIEGDLDDYEGDWEFLEHELGTRVVLKVRYDFGIPHLTELIGPTLSKRSKKTQK